MLGDVLPVPLAHEVMSFGDLIVVVRRRRRRARAEPAARPRDRRVVATTSRGRPRTARASVDQVWGTAPSGAPVSASQYSANPERTAPATIDLDERRGRAASNTELVAASHSR